MSFYFKTALIILHICLCSRMLQAQTDSTRAPRNNVYLELGGKGQIYSINLERQVYKIRTVKGAIAVAGASTKAFWHTGLEHNIFIGKSVHNLELGAGINYLIFTDPNNISENKYINGRVGYRFQPMQKGIMVRIAYTPIFWQKQNILHWVGLSFGYSF